MQPTYILLKSRKASWRTFESFLFPSQNYKMKKKNYMTRLCENVYISDFIFQRHCSSFECITDTNSFSSFSVLKKWCCARLTILYVCVRSYENYWLCNITFCLHTCWLMWKFKCDYTIFYFIDSTLSEPHNFWHLLLCNWIACHSVISDLGKSLHEGGSQL